MCNYLWEILCITVFDLFLFFQHNVMVFIAELFWWFEVVKPDFVKPRDLQEIKDGKNRVLKAQCFSDEHFVSSHDSLTLLLLFCAVIDNPLLQSDSESVSSAKEFPPPCAHIQCHQAKLLNSLPFSRLTGDSCHSWRLYALLLAPRGVLVCVSLFDLPNLLHIAVCVLRLFFKADISFLFQSKQKPLPQPLPPAPPTAAETAEAHSGGGEFR